MGQVTVDDYLTYIPARGLQVPCSSSSTKTTMPANPRDLEGVQVSTWDTFKECVDEQRNIALSIKSGKKLSQLIEKERSEYECESEGQVEAAITSGLFNPLERLMIYLGFPGEFKRSPRRVILDPDFSWESKMRKESTERSSPDTAYALRINTILVEVKTFWALDLPDNLVPILKKLQAEQSAPPTKRSKKDDPGDPGVMAGKVMRAVSQIYGYMSVNHLRFGVVATLEKFIFLRRTSSAKGSAPVLEITKVVHRDQTRQFHEFTLMEAWLGLIMVAEKDHLFTSPYPSPDVKQRILKIKRPIELVRSARIGNLYFAERITRDGWGYERGITSGQLGVVVDGGIYGQDEKNSVMKIIDTSKDSHKAKKLSLEMDAYRALESLQGQIVPKVHGFLLIHNWIMVLVLSQCGNKIESDQFVARYGEIKVMLKKIHAAGVVHGDLARRNILIGKKEKITIIDFSEAKLRSISTEDFSKGCKEDWDCLERLLETSKRNSDTRIGCATIPV